MLAGEHPHTALLPAADMALVWAAHMALPSIYTADCARVLGPDRAWCPDYLYFSPQQWADAYTSTCALYEARYGEVYCPYACAWVDASAVYPLAAPGSPLGLLLVQYDKVDALPSKAAGGLYRSGCNTGNSDTSIPLGEPDQDTATGTSIWAAGKKDQAAVVQTVVPPARAGAHALYLAWEVLYALRASHFEACERAAASTPAASNAGACGCMSMPAWAYDQDAGGGGGEGGGVEGDAQSAPQASAATASVRHARVQSLEPGLASWALRWVSGWQGAWAATTAGRYTRSSPPSPMLVVDKVLACMQDASQG